MHTCTVINERSLKESSKCIVLDEEYLRHAGNNEMPIISLSDVEDDSPSSTHKIIPKKRICISDSLSEEDNYKIKRRKINVAGAPKMPLNGYVRYMNDRREALRKEHPSKSAMEHTKIIGEEWHQLSDDRKEPYMKAAEMDKQRYVAELHIFLKKHPEVLANEIAKTKPRKNITEGKLILKDKSHINRSPKIIKESASDKTTSSNSDKDDTPSPLIDGQHHKRTPSPYSNGSVMPVLLPPVPGEIPIFTNEFIEHNKVVDLELRTLRKSKLDLEQQNAVLEKHVENMKFGVQKMVTENNELQQKNRLLEIYLDKLKRKLANALSGLSIPTEPNGATLQNIDKYMHDLLKMAASNTHGPASLNKARDIIRKLDLQIQFMKQVGKLE